MHRTNDTIFSGRIRWSLGFLAVGALFGAFLVFAVTLPAAAFGSTVSLTGGALSYTAASGETNDLEIDSNGLLYTVTDAGAAISPGLGCISIQPNVVDCLGVVTLSVDVGDMADTATVSGVTGATVSGGDGDDTLISGGGDDTLNGGNGDDDLTGGAGADVLNGNAERDMLDGGTGADVLSGGADIDSVTYSDRSGGVSVTLDNVVNDGEAGENDNVRSDVQNVIGGSGNDVLTGSAGTNVLAGAAGNDVLDGGTGPDTLSGGAGGDTVTYAGRSNGTTVTIDGVADDGESGESDNIGPDVENLTGGSGPDSLTGDSGQNMLTGGAGADQVEGGEGADTISGDAGFDLLRTRDSSADLVYCGLDQDSVIADPADAVGADCEVVDRGIGSENNGTAPEGGSDDGGSGGGELAPGTVAIPVGTVRMTTSGLVGIRLTCKGAGSCTGTLKVKTATWIHLAGKRKSRRLAVGTGSFTLSSGRSVRIKFKLAARLRRMVARERTLRLLVTATTRQSASGTKSVSRRIHVTRRPGR